MKPEYRALWESAGGTTPANWDFLSIADLLENPKSISVGVMYPGADTPGGVPLIRVSNVKDGSILQRPDFCVSKEVDEEYKRTRLNGSELLITLVGNPGDCVIASEEMIGWNAARALAVIRLKDPTLRPWLRYVLLSKPAKHLIDARLNTTVQKTLNLKDIKELSVPLPPKEERNRITNIIAGIEHKATLNRKINQTLEEMAQVIFKSWFVNFEPVKAKIEAKANGQDPERAAMCAISGKTDDKLNQLPPDQLAQLRGTAALFPDELTDSELGLIPKGWKVSTVENVCDFQNGYAFKSKEMTANSNNAYKVFKMGNIKKGGGFNRNKSKDYFPIKSCGKLGRYIIKKGDLLMCMTDMKNNVALLGHTALMDNSDEFLLNQRVGLIRTKDQQIVNYPFLYILTNSQGFIEDLRSRANSGVQVNLSTKEIKDSKFILPQKDVHQAFDTLCTPIYEKLFQLDREIVSLEALRDILLPKLLSGEIEMKQAE